LKHPADDTRHNPIALNTIEHIVPSFEKSTPRIDENDPKLLDNIASQYTRITGEMHNIKTLFCCLLSKDLPRQYRSSVIISNQSSTGKSYLLNNILEPFKTSLDHECVFDFTHMTEAYLKRAFTNVDGLIFKIEQIEDRNEQGLISIGRLKHLMTECKLTFGQYDNDESDKDKKNKKYEVTGLPIIVTTATEFNLDSETQSRFFMMQLDESDEQTKKILKHTMGKYNSDEFKIFNDNRISGLKKIIESFYKMGRRTHGIFIPFTDQILETLPSNLQMRRDIDKILNLTCAHAFIHAKNRDMFVEDFELMSDQNELEEKYYIIARVEDYKAALDMAGDTITQTINQSSKKLMMIMSLLRKLHGEKSLTDVTGVTVKEVSKHTDVGDNRVRSLLYQLIEREFVYREENGKEYLYYPTEKEFSKINGDKIEQDEQDYASWVNRQITLTKRRFVSCK